MWVITITCLSGKASTVFMRQRDSIWISTSVVFELNLMQCHTEPSGSHYRLRSDVTGNRAVWHFDLSSIEIYRVSNVTHHNMTIESSVLQRWRCECQTPSFRPWFCRGKKDGASIKKKKRKERIRYMVVVQTTYSSLDPFEQTVVLMPALWVDN